MKGYIHSIESFSTLDGPGIRSVVFLQGCPLRCVYCHNPDTWIMKKGTLCDSQDIIDKVSRNLNYITGVTISGGEPTMQSDFLCGILKGFKSIGLHTAVDTSGYVSIEDVSKIIDFTDLFIVDIKHMDMNMCKKLTGKGNEKALSLLEYLDQAMKDLWIRSVLIPDVSDDEYSIKRLCSYVKSLSNVKRFELLPYHDMAKDKYERLKIKYSLADLFPHSHDALEKLKLKFAKYYGNEFVI